MADKPHGNVERLERAGLITAESLPVAYVEVLEDLDERQIDDLIKLRDRLGEAEERLRKEDAPSGAVLIVECFGVPL